MNARLIGAVTTIAMATLLASCSSFESGSSPKSVQFDLNGTSLEVDVRDPAGVTPKGYVVLIDGSPESEPAFVVDITERLNATDYAVLSLPNVATLSGTELSGLLRAVKAEMPENAELSLFAFGDAGPGAWLALEEVEDLVATAFMVSSALPSEDIDFASLSATGIRGVYAADSASYTSSYWKAHLAMRDLDTPHDFLIFGGDIGDSFYVDPSPLARSTWNETADAAIDWLSLWEGPELAPLKHHG